MNISFEQVEALREHAKVGYGDAKAALEATGGDMLEAIILLEKEGKVTPPQGGTYVTGGGQVREKNEAAANAARQAAKGGQSGQAQEIYLESDKNDKDSSFGRQMKSLFDSFCRLVHKGNVNNFEIYRYGKKTISLPINVLILALLFCFWITLPLLVVGLFFNFRYRFYGPDIGKDTLNKFMDQASQTAKDIKQAVREDENAGKGDNQGNRG
ncbi:MAG: ubiquitin [Peptococcaceae bacterium]|nr:ubiquitin [Peptococcaceae bacterium]